mgnify:CR=1 FL=1
MVWNKTPFQPEGFGAVIWLRTKGRSAPLKLGRKAKIGLVLLAAVGGTVGYLTYRETLPKIDGLGSRVSIQVLEEVEGVANLVSRNGTFASIATTQLGPAYLVDRTGRLVKFKGSWDALYSSIVFISDAGIARGVRIVNDGAQTFEMGIDGKVRDLGAMNFAIRAGTPNGRVLIGEDIRYPRAPVIVRDGIASKYVSPPEVTGDIVLEEISADGGTILARAGPVKTPYTTVIQGGRTRLIRPAIDAIPNALSRNGHYAVVQSSGDLYLVRPTGIRRLGGIAIQPRNWWTDFVEKIEKIRGAKALSTPSVLESPEALYVSDDGRSVLAQRLIHLTSPSIKESRERESVFAWSDSSGWVTLAEEIQKRGGRFPAGWSLGGINAVSDDGQTMVGYAVNGKRQAPLILRFSD